jgi:hypothetical protein
MVHPMQTRRSHCLFLTLSALTGLAGLTGCGSEPPTPPIGSEKFEEDRKAYQDARRKEYNRESLDGKSKAKPAGKSGGG